MHNTTKVHGRKLRPRDPYAVMPVAVTQLNCGPLLGIEPRRYLALVREHEDLPRTKIGKLVAVDIADFRALLGKLATRGNRDDEDELHGDAADDDIPETSEGMLRALGVRSR